MIKKISILSLLLLFFVSTTSLPFTIHFCKMQEKMDDGMCKMEMNQSSDSHMSCPGIMHEDDNTQQVKQFPCCGTKTVDLSIKDHFLNNRTDSPQFVQLLSVLPGSSPVISPIALNKVHYSNNDISPPPRYDNNLYLSFSLLLI